MVDVKSINLSFSVKVTEANVNMLKRLFNNTNMVRVEEEDEIEIGEEIDLNFCFEGQLEDSVITMAMLFNGDLVGKPLIRLSRE